MKEIRTQAFVREGALEGKSESSHYAASKAKGADTELKPRFPMQESEMRNEDTESYDNSNNNNHYNSNEDGGSWGPYHPANENGCEMPPRPEHFNPIVGLENLGNTCYANSVFQVLRFTPGFTTGLRHIVEQMEFVEIKLQEKKERDKKALDLTNRMESNCGAEKRVEVDEDDSLKVDEDDRKTWRIVRLMRDIFVSMAEKDFRSEGAGCVAPKDLLNAVREVNPMFEENIQQDAPEFLHCLLVYVQEASKQIFKLQDILSPPKPLLLMPVHDDDKMEDDQDSKSDKSDAPSTSSGYDSDPAVIPSPQPDEKSTSGKKSKKPTLLSKGQLRITSMFTKSAKNAAATLAGASSSSSSSKTVSTKRNANGTFTRIISPQKAVAKSIFKSSSQTSTSKNSTATAATQLHPAKRRRTGSISREGGDKEKGIGGIVPLDDSVRSKVADFLNVSARSDIVTRLFEGKMVIKTTCQNCDTVSERTEPYQDLSVPVRMEEADDEDEKRSSDSGLGSSGIGMSPTRDMGMFSDDEFVEEETPRVCWPLNVLCKPERLADQNKYACDVCRTYTEAVRATQYQQLPPILNVHLKRFSATMGNGMYGPTLTKINDFLSTPFDLPSGLTTSFSDVDLALQSPVSGYTLYAIIMHQGTSLSVGHYTAYIRVCHVCFPPIKREDVEKFEGEYEHPLTNGSVCRSRHYSSPDATRHGSHDNDNGYDNGSSNHSGSPNDDDSNENETDIEVNNNNGDENGNVVRNENDPPTADNDANGNNYKNNNDGDHSTSAGAAMSQSLENLSLSDAPHKSESAKSLSSCADKDSFSWYECDDAEVSPISKERLAYRLAPVSNGATSYATPYMLLYTRSCH